MTALRARLSGDKPARLPAISTKATTEATLDSCERESMQAYFGSKYPPAAIRPRTTPAMSATSRNRIMPDNLRVCIATSFIDRECNMVAPVAQFARFNACGFSSPFEEVDSCGKL